MSQTAIVLISVLSTMLAASTGGLLYFARALVPRNEVHAEFTAVRAILDAQSRAIQQLDVRLSRIEARLEDNYRNDVR